MAKSAEQVLELRFNAPNAVTALRIVLTLSIALVLGLGGKTDALVEAVITWVYCDKEFKTKAVDSDQTEAAIKATEKMLNIIERNHFS